ncbi:MAG: peptidoglycan editing factor PgeF, partial [Cyanobacteria bacterium J06641_5]
PDPDLPEADGLVSDRSQQALWTASADCTPALIADAATGRVAAVHAGWRGTAQRVIPAAIARLEALGSHREDLRVALGPAIAGEVYQVGEAVALDVGASLFPEDAPPSLEGLWELPQTPLLPDPEPGRVRLDVRRVNQLQLLGLGLSPSQISIAPHCTFQEPERFFSYRRSHEKKIQRSGIVSQA